jgi:hypothetical protein
MNENEIKYLRQKIRKGPDQPLLQKPFALGMYHFAMFIIRYYSRVREQLKIDYDSFIILQTVASHTLYQLNKKKIGAKSYAELEKEWGKLITKDDISQIVENLPIIKKMHKLSISSICLVTSLPKETTRRKVNGLSKKNLIKISKKTGITLGSQYIKIFRNYVPETAKDVTKLIKSWEKNGVLKSILDFKI